MPKTKLSKGRPKGSSTFDPTLAKAIGEATRDLRLNRFNLSQETLANAAAIERSHMGKIERGEHMPTLAAIWKLAAAFGIPPPELVSAIEDKLPEGYDPLNSIG